MPEEFERLIANKSTLAEVGDVITKNPSLTNASNSYVENVSNSDASMQSQNYARKRRALLNE